MQMGAKAALAVKQAWVALRAKEEKVKAPVRAVPVAPAARVPECLIRKLVVNVHFKVVSKRFSLVDKLAKDISRVSKVVWMRRVPMIAWRNSPKENQFRNARAKRVPPIAAPFAPRDQAVPAAVPAADRRVLHAVNFCKAMWDNLAQALIN